MIAHLPTVPRVRLRAAPPDARDARGARGRLGLVALYLQIYSSVCPFDRGENPVSAPSVPLWMQADGDWVARRKGVAPPAAAHHDRG